MTTLITTDFAGQARVSPRLVRIDTDQTYLALTTPGFVNTLSPINGTQLLASDIVFAYWGRGTTAPGQGWFSVSISSGTITLVARGSQIADVSATLAQFQAMFNTPIPVVPAQGANTAIILESATVSYQYGSAQLVGGGLVGFTYGNAAHIGSGAFLASNTQQTSDFTGATSSTLYQFVGASGNSSQQSLSNIANVGVYLTCGSGVYTGGTGASFFIRARYFILPTNS